MTDRLKLAALAKDLASEPWPPGASLARLVGAAKHLLNDHSCDVHGYEGIGFAIQAAEAIPGGPSVLDGLLSCLGTEVEALVAELSRVTAERDEVRAELMRRIAECEEVRARGRELRREVEALKAERDALREDVKSGARTTLVILRRVRDALGAIGVPGIADCDDPLSALDATVAEALEASRALREGAAREVDAHNALVGRLAKMLPREACRALREYGCPQPEWVVWRVGERDADRWIYRQRDYGADSRGRLYEAHRSGYSQMLEDRATEGVEAIWLSGLAVDRITADAVQIVVPPVGGSRG